MDPSEEIKQLYFKATSKTIDRDLDRAIDLLKAMPDEGARERLAVYMEGLAQMRSEARGGGGEGGGHGGPRQGAKAGKKPATKPGAPASPAPGTPAKRRP